MVSRLHGIYVSTVCNPFLIPIPLGDPFYDVTGTGTATMNFCRTIWINGTGTSVSNRREFPNNVNSFLDAGTVYGSSTAVNTALRTFQNGMMKNTTGPDGRALPPINNDGSGNPLVTMANNAKRVPTNTLYACGDARCNENPILLSLHTLFLREHNRRAALLPSNWTDEQKFQEARRWVIGHVQSITFNEYLPTLINQKPPTYVYNSSLNPQVSAFFSTVAFRYGHDEVSGIISRYNKSGLPYIDGNILLRDAYFFPDAVGKVGIDPYLRGAAVNQQNAVDGQIDEDLRTFLFNQAPALATDLAARNMQRARDHGIARYNDCRKAYGLSTCSNFSCVNSDPRIIGLLNQAYGTDNVTFLDPYVGGLLEQKLPGSNLGQLFTVAIVEQLVRSRNADRFWYQNPGVFTKDELAILESTKLSDILKRNCDIPSLPKDIFNRRDIPPAVALGGAQTDDTKYIIAIIIPSVVAAILVIVVIGMCFANKSNSNVSHDDLHHHLLEEK